MATEHPGITSTGRSSGKQHKESFSLSKEKESGVSEVGLWRTEERVDMS